MSSCGDHRTLSLVVGWLNVVLSIIACIAVLISWFVLDLPRTAEDKWAYGEPWEYGKTLLVLIISYIVVWFIISVLLIKGIKENNHRYMAPWVYMNFAIVIFLIFLTFYDILDLLIQGISFVIILMVFIVNCLSVGLGILILYPVYMLFRKIRKIRLAADLQHEMNSHGIV